MSLKSNDINGLGFAIQLLTIVGGQIARGVFLRSLTLFFGTVYTDKCSCLPFYSAKSIKDALRFSGNRDFKQVYICIPNH